MRPRWLDLGWLVACAAASSVLCAHAGHRIGATFDEPFYVAKGLDAWRTGSNRPLMTAGTMPLPVDVLTLPLYLRERQAGVEVRPYDQLRDLLPTIRLGNLPFWWLLLFYAWRWGRLAGGEWGGRFAVGFAAFEPNLLAHASLATTDIAATGTVLAAAFHWHVGRDATWPRRVVVPGVWYAVALCAKASALAFVPLLFTLHGLMRLNRADFTRRTVWPATWGVRRDLALTGGIGLLIVLGYCGCDWRADPTFVVWADKLPDAWYKSAVQGVARHLAIFPNGGEGLVQQVKHNTRGHGAYVLGEYHPRAVWYYFPVALSAKLPLVVLWLMAVVLVTRPRSPLTPVGAAVLLLFMFSFNCRVQIGVRLVLPLVVFGLIWLATAWKQPAGRFGLLARGITLVGLIGVSVSMTPDNLLFVNRLYGGPERGREVLADSNYDWGQGLPALAEWHAGSSHSDEPLFVWYYGADPRILVAPFHITEAHKWPDPTPDRLTRATGNGVLAVSVSLLDACPYRRPELLALVAWLRTREPVGRTGCFVVYRLR